MNTTKKKPHVQTVQLMPKRKTLQKEMDGVEKKGNRQLMNKIKKRQRL